MRRSPYDWVGKADDRESLVVCRGYLPMLILGVREIVNLWFEKLALPLNMPPALQIRLLDGFSLSYADQPAINVTSDQLRALLAYLVLDHHTPKSHQRLAFEFWQDSTDAQARTNLRRELHHLRQPVC